MISAVIFSLAVLLVQVLPGPRSLMAMDTEFSGFLETRHNVQVKSPNDILASETLARLELTAVQGGFTAFGAVNLSANHLLEEESGVSLHEGYLDYVRGNATLRAGRQIIIWGQADGIRIVDNVSPLDYSETITRDFDEMRMAVDAFNFKYASGWGDLQILWIPVYKSGEQPSTDSPWYLGGYGDNTVAPANEPDDPFKDSELALRYTRYLSGMDLALSYLYAWNDFPCYQQSGTVLEPVYDRVHILGAEFSKPWGEFVFRAEAAWFAGSLVQGYDSDYFTAQKDRIKWLAGLDWYPGGDWTLSWQYSQDHILNAGTNLTESGCAKTATMSLSKDLFREKLTLSAFGYMDVDKKDYLVRLTGEYQFIDNLEIFLGTDIFAGDRKGSFGRYKDNTQAWTKIKYHF
ncbi:DUF1302 family protein [uncultured Desulfobacter sp.]|uniref:DUF1302 family protein n=1 Tax=uncultured Desulfobacter sp. TaxID=240139 RepID=UPI002AAB7B86|nr:DUF1302 family protein [uncultured Desulfobacter sp.]